MSVFRALYVSLFIHMFLYLGINFFPSRWTAAPESQIAEIEILNRPFDEKDEQQFVRQTPVPEKMKLEDDSTARFMSEQKQRVLLETRAKNSGLTQNADESRPQRHKMEQTQRKPTRDISGYEPIELPNPNQIMPEGQSTVGEALPKDVAVGSFTALNTDRFQYYSFYARIEELVRFRWETEVRKALTTFDQKYFYNHIGRKNWITQAEFLLSADGHLKVSRIVKQSGVQVFDTAAVAAFKDARVFPNPPKELVEKDGFIHLKYSFNVYFDTPAFASSE